MSHPIASATAQQTNTIEAETTSPISQGWVVAPIKLKTPPVTAITSAIFRWPLVISPRSA